MDPCIKLEWNDSNGWQTYLPPPVTGSVIRCLGTNAMHAPTKVIAALQACIASSQTQVHETRPSNHLLRSSAFTNDRINPAATALHGIERAASRAVLNALVLRRDGAAGTRIEVAVTASMQSRVVVLCGIRLRAISVNGRDAQAQLPGADVPLLKRRQANVMKVRRVWRGRATSTLWSISQSSRSHVV